MIDPLQKSERIAGPTDKAVISSLEQSMTRIQKKILKQSYCIFLILSRKSFPEMFYVLNVLKLFESDMSFNTR